MNDLPSPIHIQEQAGELVADSREVAAALVIQHENLLGNMEAHRATLETEFGRVRFETGTLETAGGAQRTRFAYLTENQALFLATLSRNTAAVVRVKAWLVKAFDAARRALQAPLAMPDLSDSLVLANLLQDAVSRFVEAETARREAVHELAVQAPAVAFARKVEFSPVDVSIGTYAKLIGWGPNKLHAELRRRGFMFHRDGHPVPKQRLIEQGLFTVREVPVKDRVYPVAALTGRGQLWLARELGVSVQPALIAATSVSQP